MMRNAAALNNMHAVSLSGRFYYYAQVCFAGLYFASRKHTVRIEQPEDRF